MPLSPARIRRRAAALALAAALIAPAGAQAQWREPSFRGADVPGFGRAPAPPAPLARTAKAGPVWGTQGDLALMALGAGILFGAYRLKESGHPYLATYTGLVGGLSFAMGALDLVDRRRYPTPAPRDTLPG